MYRTELAKSYFRIISFYGKRGQKEQAAAYSIRCIALYEILAKENPTEYTLKLAKEYHKCALLTDEREYFDKAYAIALTAPDDSAMAAIIKDYRTHFPS